PRIFATRLGVNEPAAAPGSSHRLTGMCPVAISLPLDNLRRVTCAVKGNEFFAEMRLRQYCESRSDGGEESNGKHERQVMNDPRKKLRDVYHSRLDCSNLAS